MEEEVRICRKACEYYKIITPDLGFQYSVCTYNNWNEKSPTGEPCPHNLAELLQPPKTERQVGIDCFD